MDLSRGVRIRHASINTSTYHIFKYPLSLKTLHAPCEKIMERADLSCHHYKQLRFEKDFYQPK